MMGAEGLIRYYLLTACLYSLNSTIKLDYCEQNKSSQSSKN